MMLRPSLLALAFVVGACGGKTADGDSSGDGGIDSASPLVDSSPLPDVPLIDSSPRPDVGTPVGSVPPPRPPAIAADGTTRWFAVKRFQLGLTRKGTTTSDPNAWKDYGFDLDQRITTAEDSKTSNNSCKRNPGSPTSILADGNLGIDNNFGGHLMQVIKSLKSDAEDATNVGVLDGEYTLLIRLDNFGPADNGRVPGALYVAGKMAGRPTFTESDLWPVTADSLIDGATIASSKFSYPNGYMTGGVWVNDDFGVASGSIPVPLFGAVVALPAQAAVVAFDTKGGSVGTLAGGVPTATMKDAITPGMKAFGICPGNATYDQVIDTLMQSADLSSGAPHLQDTTKTCDTLSFGLGFIATPTGAPTVVAPARTLPSECL